MTHVGRRVDEAEEPLIAAGIAIARVGVDVELRGEEQVGAVDHRLVHL